MFRPRNPASFFPASGRDSRSGGPGSGIRRRRPYGLSVLWGLLALSAGCDSGNPLELRFLEVSEDPLPDGMLGSPYSGSLWASGGDDPYQWAITSGSLPAGLALNGATISGLPTAAGYFPLTLEVTSGASSATADQRIRVYETPVSGEFLPLVPGIILSSLQYNQDLLPRNTHLTEEINAKTALLSDPELEEKILNGRFFHESQTTTLDGSTVPIFIGFPADSMRAGAMRDHDRLAPSIAVLEGFMNISWPSDIVLEWYGFRMGHSGGGGELYMEDRGTYAERASPHDVIISHELAHTYIGNEDLTQFLEVYVYNLVETGSTDVDAWTWKRGAYQAFAPSNSGVWALMDIFQLIGPEAMGRAYAAIHPLRPGYGEPLSAEVRQAFIDEAPPGIRHSVAALVLEI